MAVKLQGVLQIDECTCKQLSPNDNPQKCTQSITVHTNTEMITQYVTRKLTASLTIRSSNWQSYFLAVT